MTATIPHCSNSTQAISVLVVDDAKIIREMIKDTVLEQKMLVAGEAANGLDAIDLYKQLRPDLVTLDLVMPEHDGLFALRGIMQINPNAKVLLVSALNQSGVLQEATRLGVTTSITKPFKKDAMLTAMQHCLEGRRTDSNQSAVP